MRLTGRTAAVCRFAPRTLPVRTLSTSRLLFKEQSQLGHESDISKKGSTKGSTKNESKSSKLSAKLNARSRVDSISQGHDPNSRMRLDGGKKLSDKHSAFRVTALQRFKAVLAKLEQSAFTLAGIGKDDLSHYASQFMNTLDQAFFMANQNITSFDQNPLFWNMRESFITRDVKGLEQELQYSFQAFILQRRATKGLERSQKLLVDFRFPYEWFPATRTIKRTVHLHVGPTNSGKTYHALKALEQSKRGVYLGPLRLLATEVYQRLNNKGFPCALLTGEEVRIPDNTNMYHISATTEMAPLDMEVDVAVLDEIQLIDDPVRGSAWTNAVLGMQAKELHICGEERAVGIVQSICASIGDECIVHRYERLTPLQVMDKHLENGWSDLRKGDAIIGFNRLTLHGLKRSIESHTGRRCAIVYGALPPEVRVQQAALFNDPDNDYDFIVASDAIGMGMNLEIRRVVFESVTKFDGERKRMLNVSETKQIGGRAGRYRTARTEATGDEDEAAKVGYVTTVERLDLKPVKSAFRSQPPNIPRAYISPPQGIIEKFASYFPKETPLSYILLQMRQAATVGDLYSLHVSPDMLQICDAIQDIPLPVADKITFAAAPISLTMEGVMDVYRELASCVAYNKSGRLLDIASMPLDIIDAHPSSAASSPAAYLHRLEALHAAITLYTWLSYRYPSVLTSQDMAFHVRSLVEARLMQYLEEMNFTEEEIESRRKRERQRAQQYQATRDASLSENIGDENVGREFEPGTSPFPDIKELDDEPLTDETLMYESLTEEPLKEEPSAETRAS
ncbi:ATP-dependent RNA helicase SUV3 precursor [Stachybotrys elegans]|uniref:RNA helicase n=1 Tax=Stachybotrys elegans TaxID=80388 RepID=A0A8K0T178_9HYPO|nr:ATP-dependent RNA helicase SUV3 precursor [Stachybotrys elegans]